MANRPELSVVIPTLGRNEQTHELLGSLQRQICFGAFEVLVVANLPDRELKRAVESYGPRFRYFETGRIGINIARNKGIEKAESDLILFLDDDCYVFDRSFVQKHIAAHRTRKEASVVGGPYIPYAGASAKELAYHWITDHGLRRNLMDQHQAMALLGGNCSFKTRSLKSKLAFNERIEWGGSEIDLFLRMSLSGHNLYFDEDLKVEHRPKLSTSQFIRRAFLRGLEAGARRTDGPMPTTKHWNAGLSIDQTMARQGFEPTLEVRRSLRMYGHFFDYGYRRGLKLKSDEKIQPQVLRWPNYIKHQIQALIWTRLWERVYSTLLAVDRAVVLSTHPKSSPRSSPSSTLESPHRRDREVTG